MSHAGKYLQQNPTEMSHAGKYLQQNPTKLTKVAKEKKSKVSGFRDYGIF